MPPFVYDRLKGHFLNGNGSPGAPSPTGTGDLNLFPFPPLSFLAPLFQDRAVPGPSIPLPSLRARMLELADPARLRFNEAFINPAGQPATPKTGVEFLILDLIGPPGPTDFFRAALRRNVRFRI